MKGYNPMRWDCEKQGCFNIKMRPKIEIFHDCFPNRISFGDVDAEVEIKGRFIQLEWKSRGKNIPTGQDIKFKNYTKQDGWVVFVAVGDAETMVVKRYCVYWKGYQRAWNEFEDNGVEQLKSAIKRWARNAAT